MAWRPEDRPSYAYLLGLYLGDGCVTKPVRTLQLVVSCDARYPAIIDAAADAMLATGLTARVGRYEVRGSRCIRVIGASKRWLEAFPQHGPGRKHTRRIVLEPWQQEIVDEHPRAFLRGLLHSDGCRTVNRFSTLLPSGRVADYAYPRWFFSNRSDDIRALFCATCEAVGIRWTQSNPRNISISHRRSVALLDEWVGAKA
jgi:hypothetical protein